MRQLLLAMLLLIPATARGAEAPSESGRVLLDQLNCTACHAASEAQARWLLPKVGPRLGDLANRASGTWVQQYLAAPQTTMPGTTMPDVLHALPAGERAGAAEALTHYLLSQRPGTLRRVQPDRAAVARGENLYHRVGCVACHAPQRADGKGIASTPLPNMAEKWGFDALRRFLLDPLATRPSGRMPAMGLTDNEAADIAHYLLRDTHVPAVAELAVYRGRFRSFQEIDGAELARTVAVNGFAIDEGTRDRGSALRLSSWIKIEQAGDYQFHFTAAGASRFAIDGRWLAGEESWEQGKVDARFSRRLEAGWHELRANYVQRRQGTPAMKLEWEGPGIPAGEIPAARLHLERDEARALPAFSVDVKKAAAGQALYQKLQCGVCHEDKGAKVAAPALAALAQARGCLAEAPPADAPDFHLSAQQRASLQATLIALNVAELQPPTASEQLAHTLAGFNCVACHAREKSGGVTAARDRYFTSNGEDLGDEGRLPPNLTGVGDKLQGAWLEQVLTEGASVRPYLDTRMPQFGKQNVGKVAELLVAIDRHAQPMMAVADPAEVQKEAGRVMVGTEGLSCIACHRFNRQPAQTMQVIDLITATQRLNADWFGRFLLDPNRFHPGTRMPAFWPEGKSPLTKLLGGDTTRQHAAIWTYLADGPRAKFPQGLSRENLELTVGGEAVVYRGKLWEAGFRAVAVGYPGQVNAAFDAEEMRLSLLWRGKFLNAGPHWQVQGMGQIRPLGTDVVAFPHGAPMAVLGDAKAPWPAEASKKVGFKFRGYQMDALQRPTLMYALGTMGVEDFLAPLEGSAGSGLRRTLTFSEAPPEGLHMRLAVGRLKALGENLWRLNDAMTISVKGNVKAFVRGTGDQQELLVPVRVNEKSRQLEVEYAW